jgi:NAD(P)-dependent dehydrogenase (short-subunit alcohol dehydrogenase family)
VSPDSSPAQPGAATAANAAAGESVVVVIGGSSGIGLAAARQFAEQGRHLVLASRSAVSLKAAASQCQQRGAASVLEVVADVGSEAAVRTLFDQAMARHGRIDVVVHTATVMAYGSVEALPTAVFERVVDTATHGTFHVARAALAVFRDQRVGTLIVVNSLLGAIAAPDMSAYVTAKWAQAGLIRALQLETRDEPGIRVCSVAPGGVNTPIYSQAANVTGRTAQPPPPIDPPEKVARAIVRLVDRPRPRVSVGLANHLIVLGFRATPKLYDALVGPLFRFASLSATSTAASDGNVFAPVSAGEAAHGQWPRRWQLPEGAAHIASAMISRPSRYPSASSRPIRALCSLANCQR